MSMNSVKSLKFTEAAIALVNLVKWMPDIINSLILEDSNMQFDVRLVMTQWDSCKILLSCNC